MVIVREKHPLQGQALRVLGRMHREGALHLILTLPDGGTSLIPVTWTDLSGGGPLSPPARVLGSAADLRHIRRVADALLRRQDGVGTRPAEEEDADATGTVSHRPPDRQAANRPDLPESGGTGGADQESGAAAGQDHPAAKEGAEP